MRSLTGPKVRNPPVGRSWTPCWGIPRQADEPSPGSWCSTCLRRRTGCQWCPGVATESDMEWWNRITAGYLHVFFLVHFKLGKATKISDVCVLIWKKINIWIFIKGRSTERHLQSPRMWKQRLLSTLLVGFILTSRRYILSHCGPLKVRIFIAYEATAAVSLLIGRYEAALIKGQKPPVRI